MNFFEHQDQARARTGRLVWMFAAAVGAVVASVYLLAVAAMNMASENGANGAFRLWMPEVAVIVLPLVVATVAIASWVRIRTLRQGGAAIAASAGGREVASHTRDPGERRLVNVVEEIAIASGVPVPRVFVLDREDGINAFAAGYSIDDAAIGVTRGCIEKLDRDELQGVVAHEFSHILNGDMRLNIRLIGYIAGLVVIGVTGRMVLRAVFHGSGSRRRRSNGNGGGAAIAIFVVGLGLIVIGFVGTLAGQLIQAAISRQREYLADASAVQFTRNPGGLRGALSKIAGIPEHGMVVASNVADMRHMFFSQVTAGMFGGLATHPPIEERIRRLGGTVAAAEIRARGAAAPASAAGGVMVGLAGPSAPAAGPQHAPSPAEDYAAARRLIEQLPEVVRDAAHDPVQAPALLHAVLLADASSVVSAQLRALARNVSPAHAASVEALARSLHGIPHTLRLPLIELSAPTLRGYPKQTRDALLNDTQRLMAMDGLSLSEVLLLACVERWISAEAAPRRRVMSPRGHASWRQDVALVVGACVSSTALDSADATEMLAHARAAVEPSLASALPTTAAAATAGDVRAAIDRLAGLSGAVRQQLLAALAAAVLSDRRITRAEADLCGAIAALVSAPAPPLDLGQPA